jgi:hypothetical protein
VIEPRNVATLALAVSRSDHWARYRSQGNRMGKRNRREEESVVCANITKSAREEGKQERSRKEEDVRAKGRQQRLGTVGRKILKRGGGEGVGGSRLAGGGGHEKMAEGRSSEEMSINLWSLAKNNVQIFFLCIRRCEENWRPVRVYYVGAKIFSSHKRSCSLFCLAALFELFP